MAPLRVAALLLAAALVPACGGVVLFQVTVPAAFTLSTPADASGSVSTTPTFTWTTSVGATRYTLQISTTSGFAVLAFEQTGIPGTSVSPGPALTNSTLYYWRVLAVNDSGSALASNGPFSFTTVAPAPVPPGSFAMTAPADGALSVDQTPTFSWGASTGAVSYTLQVSISNTFSSFAVNQSGINSTSATPAVILNFSTTYYWRVEAINGAGTTMATGSPRSFTVRPAPGSLDPSFGTNGRVLTDFGFSGATAYAVALQSDGKIVVAGEGFNGTDLDFAVARYDADGALDPTFGIGGRALVQIGSGYDSARAVAIQADGKIVAVGTSFVGTSLDTSLLRLNADGTPDPTFGSNGRVITQVTPMLDFGFSVALQADGKILVASFQLLRYTTAGVLDSTFDGDGMVVPGGEAVTIQPDGMIVTVLAVPDMVGPDLDFQIRRWDSSGVLDPGFGSGGIAHVTVDSNYHDYPKAVRVQADGKIVVAGLVHSSVGTNHDIAVVRLTAAGLPDGSFGTGGILTTSIDSREDEAHALALQADGKIVVAGLATQSSTNKDFAVVRYNAANGAPDASFDVDGILRIPVGSGDDQAYGVAVQPDGRIVVVGYSFNGTNTEFAIVRLVP